MQYATNITLYNKYIDPTTRSELWHRTYIMGVIWRNKAVSGIAPLTFNIQIEIPFLRCLNYIRPSEWRALTPKGIMWTLQTEDIIVRGITDAEIKSITQDIYEYFSVSDMRKANDDVCTIKSIGLSDVPTLSKQKFIIGAA